MRKKIKYFISNINTHTHTHTNKQKIFDFIDPFFSKLHSICEIHNKYIYKIKINQSFDTISVGVCMHKYIQCIRGCDNDDDDDDNLYRMP